MVSDSMLSVFSSFGVRDVAFDEPMAKHTTWRIGGSADAFVRPADADALRAVVQAAKRLELPITVIGRGSNSLVLDGGIRGIVVNIHDGLSEISVDEDEDTVVAMAGRSFVSTAAIAIRHGLAGLEFATGIPGSVGGAIMMNAGAYGRETREALEWADVMNMDGDVRRLTNEQLQFGYRYSILKDEPGIVVRAKFKLVPGDKAELSATVKSWSRRRIEAQPLSFPNCGSVFRNPDGLYAGKLVEAAGLKGLSRGGAQISEKHGNFIINTGNATAEDVLWLICHAKNTIQTIYGIQLETEVRVLGESASGR